MNNHDSSNEFVRKVQGTIRRFDMIRENETILVGVSGGPDSMALLHFLMDISRPMRFSIGIAHLNHCLRGEESDRDEQFVKSIADKFGLPLFSRRTDIKKLARKKTQSIEETGRNSRYTFFTDICHRHGYDKIALGHTLNDNVESILLFFLRGAGSAGVTGIPPVRDGMIVRPLIETTREKVLEFIRIKRIPFMEDSSNLDISFTRNRIRCELIPILQKHYNPCISDALVRFASIMKDEEQWMQSMIESIFSKCLISSEKNFLALDADLVFAQNRAVLRRIVRKAIETVKGNLRRISFNHMESVIHLKNKNGKKIHLPEGIRVEKKNQILYVFRIERADSGNRKNSTPCKPSNYDYEINAPGAIEVPEMGAVLMIQRRRMEIGINEKQTSPNRAVFDADLLRFPLTVRNFRPGDRFQPLGMTGTKKLSHFFIDNKVAREKRPVFPLLVSEGQIVWVIGLRMDDRFKVTEKTRRMIQIDFTLLEKES